MTDEGDMESDQRYASYDAAANKLSLGGEWDFALKSELRALTARLHASHAATLDLTRVRFMDSSVINEIFHTFNRLTAEGGGLRLIVGDDRIERLLKTTKVDTIMEISRADPA